jgi:SPP1 gp7 family putative phage head morphogenesis protein
MLQLPLAPPDAARLLLQAWLRVNGGEAAEPKIATSKNLPVHGVADASVAAIKKAFKDSVSSAGITDPASALALIEQNGARLREALAKVLLRVVVASGQVHARGLPKRTARAAEASFGNGTLVQLHGVHGVVALRSLAPQRPATSVGMTFDAANPAAVAWARDRAAALVKDITDDQRQSIRDLVAGSLNKDLSRRELVRDIEDVIGLTSKQGEGLMSLRDELEAEGLSQAEINDEVSARSGEMLDDRAAMIAHTESMAAANQGQLELWDQAVADGWLTGDEQKVWIATPDTVVCDDCETLDGETVGLDEEFSMGGDPPLHPFCRCTVALAGMPGGTTEEG